MDVTRWPAVGPWDQPRSDPGRWVAVRGQLGKRFPEGRKRLRELAEQGKIKPWYTEVNGLENAPQAFVDMVNGKNTGSVIIRP